MSRPGSTITDAAPKGATSGLVAGILAFGAWGLFPLYWRQLQGVPSDEILAHRFVWTFLFCAGMLSVSRKWPDILAGFRSRRQVILSAASGAMIASNWFLFIWAVNTGHIVETSIGYFMTPLMNVLFGIAVFRERLASLQWFAVAIAAAGVTYAAVNYGEIPWIAFGLCGSFGLYGVLRKVSHANSLTGLFMETAIVAPFMLAYLFWKTAGGSGAFRLDHPFNALFLAGSGIVTGFPLIWFAQAAKQLKLSTVGILQYIAPSLSLLIGVFVYGELFTPARKVTFGCIWLGLLLFNVSTYLRRSGAGGSRL